MELVLNDAMKLKRAKFLGVERRFARRCACQLDLRDSPRLRVYQMGRSLEGGLADHSDEELLMMDLMAVW